jgi:hypothetical protein
MEEVKLILRQIDTQARRPFSLADFRPGDIVGRFRAIHRKTLAAENAPAIFEFAGLLDYQEAEFRQRYPKMIQDLRMYYQVRMKTPVTNSQHIALVDGLTVATAIELYRRANGSYPESLDALAPQYVPALPPDHSRANRSYTA